MSGKVVVDITDHNVNKQQLEILRKLASNNQIVVQDTNWFGGVWSLNDYLKAENLLDDVAEKINSKASSNFEYFICAYHYATNRNYKFAPKGSPFQACRSYVDVLNNGYCVCVGYATILKRLCEKRGIPCAVQGCLAKDKYGKVVNHANCLVFLRDEKYGVFGLFYSDPRMDCLDFQDKSDLSWNLNMLALPITEIGKIQIKLWDDDTIIEMNDFQSIYYSRRPTQFDLDYFGKFFNFTDTNTVMWLKYCKGITLNQIQNALKNIGLSQEQIIATSKNLVERQHLFLQEYDSSNAISNEWQKRLAFGQYIQDFVSHAGRKDNVCKLDCATFVYVLYKNFFGVDILENGFGGSWTGKIATSKIGAEPKFIDENASIEQKINFIDTKCKAGDILFFHRQSLKESNVSDENFYPGHCAIYLGNHKFIDSRLTTRGGIAISDIETDNYMPNFVGFKDVISALNITNKLENESSSLEF